MLKVLVVDDSALMRKALTEILQVDGDMEVATARDGRDALERIPEVEPDVITLDINMPVMDGLTCLSHIVTRGAQPVVMISSLTEKGALATLEALEMGAVDYIPKPGGTISLNIRDIGQQIRAKVRAAVHARPRRARDVRPPRAAPAPHLAQRKAPQPSGAVRGLVLVGVSTGGPSTLETVLRRLPERFDLPVLVCQHMPGRFTEVFARRLDGVCALAVREVSGPTPILPGHVYIGRGDSDLVVSRRQGTLVASSVPEDASLWHPSADRMVRSACSVLDPGQLIGVLLTGMGHDGAEAMAELHRRGGRTIAESESSAVVFGMPRELIEREGASIVLDADQVAAQLAAWAGEVH